MLLRDANYYELLDAALVMPPATPDEVMARVKQRLRDLK